MTKRTRILLASIGALVSAGVVVLGLGIGLTRYLPVGTLLGEWSTSEPGRAEAHMLIQADGTFEVENLPKAALLDLAPEQSIYGTELDWSDVVSFDGRWYFSEGVIVLSTNRDVAPSRALSVDLRGFVWAPQLATVFDVERGRTLTFTRDSE